MRGWKPEAVLQWAWQSLGAGLVMRADFGLIDLPVLSMVAQFCPELPIFFVDTGGYPRKHLVFRDRLARDWGLNLEVCKKEPKILAHAPVLQSDLARSQYIVNQGRLCVRPQALWSLADLYGYLTQHNLPRPPCFASLPSVETTAEWLSLPPYKIKHARPLAGLPSMQKAQVFQTLSKTSGPQMAVLGVGYHDGQKVTALNSLQALGELLNLEGKPVEAYADEELARLVNLLSNQRTLTSPAALKKMGRLDEVEFARVSQKHPWF